MFMRLFLGMLLALTVLLTGCGSEGADEQADDPDPAETSSTPTPTNGPVDFTHVGVVSESAAGGQVDPQAVDLSDDAALADFVVQFEDDRMAAALEAAVADAEVAEGETLVGAVVALGCVPPKEVTVERTEGGLEINAMPAKESDPAVQCLVAITSVAVVTVDASLV